MIPRIVKQTAACILLSAAGCAPAADKNTVKTDITKDSILFLERKWLEAEFALDTAGIAPLLDSSFVSINGGHLSTKQEELEGIYQNISAMRSDSILIDSFKLEDTRVAQYENAAVVTFTVHTFKKDRNRPIEKRTRFYDVWINRNGSWKAVASQGTVIEQPNK